MDMIRQEKAFREKVLLTFQTALLGLVTAALRGVTVGWDDRTLEGYCYFDGEMEAEDLDLCHVLEERVRSEIPERRVIVIGERLDAPELLNERTREAWVYWRKE